MAEYLHQPSYNHFYQHQHQHPHQHQHHHDQLSIGMDPYGHSGMHPFANAMSQQAMMGMPPSGTKNETKPRLGKEEVEILEREFNNNQKPTTNTKRQYAEEMGVDLARINNWFQNRRAKRKQEKKTAAAEAGKTQESNNAGYSEPSSPDYLSGPTSGFFNEASYSTPALPILPGPPPAVAPYIPQYVDTSRAAMQSLQRTVELGMAASHQQHQPQPQPQQQQMFNHFGQIDNHGFPIFTDPYEHGSPDDDRAQFPSSETSIPQHQNLEESNEFSYSLPNNAYSTSDIHGSPVHTPTTGFHTYPAAPSRADSISSQLMTTFPSQRLSHQEHDGLPLLGHDSIESQSPEDINAVDLSNSGGLMLDFKNFEPVSSNNFEQPVPGPSNLLKSPGPMNIAERRKNAARPAALTPETLRSRPAAGPRTVSHFEGFRRGSDVPSPMRRSTSSGPPRGTISGRITKSSVESAQRSPIPAFMNNLHSVRHYPSMSALNSSLAPPTPMSPRDMRDMRGDRSFTHREGSRSTASPGENSFVYNTGGCFTSIENDKNLSPPETPQTNLSLHMNSASNDNSNWTGYGFEGMGDDQPLFTPAHEGFPIGDMHANGMPQPPYLHSQPVTPAFGQNFNANIMFDTETPRGNFTTQMEYTFPEGPQYSSGMSSSVSPMTKQKTFQFSNTTAADFSEKP